MSFLSSPGKTFSVQHRRLADGKDDPPSAGLLRIVAGVVVGIWAYGLLVGAFLALLFLH